MSAFYAELTVLTRPLAANPFTPGHALIAIATPGAHVEAWGFYPTGVTNELLGDFASNKYGRSSVMRINENQYRRVVAEIRQWQTNEREYMLMIRDCVAFVRAILRSADIEVPGHSLWPNSFGKDVEGKYGRGGGRCLSSKTQPALSAHAVATVIPIAGQER